MAVIAGNREIDNLPCPLAVYMHVRRTCITKHTHTAHMLTSVHRPPSVNPGMSAARCG